MGLLLLILTLQIKNIQEKSITSSIKNNGFKYFLGPFANPHHPTSVSEHENFLLTDNL